MGTVGVIIRTLNESELIGRCLETLKTQRSEHELDILVLDSGSTDDTLAIARSHGVRIHEMDPADFDYSKALNLGIELLSGDLVISLSAHSVPVDEHWVTRMTAPFEDPAVAGVSCRQLPWPDAPWQEVRRLAQVFGQEPRAYTGGDAHSVLFSNAASCIRRSVWLREPFTLPAAEDLEWAERVIAAGWTVLYEPSAAVFHSHRESPRAWAQRLIDVNRVLPGNGPRTHIRTLREAARLLVYDSRCILASAEPPDRKLAHIAELIQMVTYYVRDFSRAGSIAERRRQDSAATT